MHKQDNAYHKDLNARRDFDQQVFDFGDICARLEDAFDRAPSLLLLNASSQS